MARTIFPNLAVSDLEKSKAFYTGLGFRLNEQFTNEQAAAIVVSDEIVVMLLSPGFAEESGLALSGTPRLSLAVGLENRDEVDQIVDQAVAGGGVASDDVVDDGFMYSRGFADPDGHRWDFLWMDPAALES
jgi:uncharacterized protein